MYFPLCRLGLGFFVFSRLHRCPSLLGRFCRRLLSRRQPILVGADALLEPAEVGGEAGLHFLQPDLNATQTAGMNV